MFSGGQGRVLETLEQGGVAKAEEGLRIRFEELHTDTVRLRVLTRDGPTELQSRYSFFKCLHNLHYWP